MTALETAHFCARIKEDRNKSSNIGQLAAETAGSSQSWSVSEPHPWQSPGEEVYHRKKWGRGVGTKKKRLRNSLWAVWHFEKESKHLLQKNSACASNSINACIFVCIGRLEYIFVPGKEKDGMSCWKPWEVLRNASGWEVGSKRVQHCSAWPRSIVRIKRTLRVTTESKM